MTINMKETVLLLLIISILIPISIVSASDNNTHTLTDNSEEVLSENCDSNVLEERDDEIVENNILKENEEIINENPTNNQIKTNSKIESTDTKGYETFPTKVSFKLSSDDKPLPSKTVTISINGHTYSKITDADGQGYINLDLKKGTYTAEFNYLGDDLTTNTFSKSTITILDPIKTSLKLGDKDINYRQGSQCLFYVKLLDSTGKTIKNQNVTFKVKGKTYTAKTNSEGNAKIYLNLKKGKYKIKYSFTKTEPYLSSKGSFTIKVKSKIAKGNGYWLWSTNMKSVKLKKLAKRGTKHILLHIHAVAQYGKSAVKSFIKKAHKYGIKVHLWIQICYKNKKWVKPVNSDGSIKYGFLNKKIREAKRYAKIKGVDGIHFDYVRFRRSAHNYKKSVAAINYFVKKVSISVRKIKSKCIISAAIMPEPKVMRYTYGQDVPTMSKYLDTLIPMVYKGNYRKNRSWVNSVTKAFVKQSNGAQIWTGLQSYQSDKNTKKLSHKSLLKDAKVAKNAGAKGIMLFRIGISCNLNFKKV